jgi:hypothetical protein
LPQDRSGAPTAPGTRNPGGTGRCTPSTRRRSAKAVLRAGEKSIDLKTEVGKTYTFDGQLKPL